MNQLEEQRTKDLWQISILLDVENNSTLLLTVTKDCHTGELFQKLRLHPKTLSNADFQLFSIGGSTRSSLDENWNECLSGYDLADRSTLVLMARLPGGVWPTLEEVAAQPRHPKPADGITLTTISVEHPDVLGVEDDGPGVIMRCGHATAPTGLALFCRTELEKGKDEIRCPNCDVKWKFALLKPAACLTEKEITEFEQRAHINYFRNHQSEMNPCPRCGIFSRPHRAEDKRVVCRNCTQSLGKTFQFCWTCLGEWKTSGNETCGNPYCGSKKRLLEILANCESKILNRVEVPSKRACPNCSALIQHSSGCRHMTCKYCKYEFCFICLRKYPCGSRPRKLCDVAPCQTFDTKCIGSTANGKDKPEPRNSENLHLNNILEWFAERVVVDEIEILADDMEEPEAPVNMPAEDLVSTQQRIGASFNIERDLYSQSSGDSSNEETDNETFFRSNLASQVNEMAVTTDEGNDNGASVPGTEPIESGVIMESSRETEPAPPPKLQEVTFEATATSTSGLDGNDSDVVLEPIRKRGPPPPPKPQQRKNQARATDMICRPDQNDSDVILEPSRKRGPPPPPKPQLSVQALAKRFETILGTLF